MRPARPSWWISRIRPSSRRPPGRPARARRAHRRPTPYLERPPGETRTHGPNAAEAADRDPTPLKPLAPCRRRAPAVTRASGPRTRAAARRPNRRRPAGDPPGAPSASRARRSRSSSRRFRVHRERGRARRPPVRGWTADAGGRRSSGTGCTGCRRGGRPPLASRPARGRDHLPVEIGRPIGRGSLQIAPSIPILAVMRGACASRMVGPGPSLRRDEPRFVAGRKVSRPRRPGPGDGVPRGRQFVTHSGRIDRGRRCRGRSAGHPRSGDAGRGRWTAVPLRTP